MPSPRKNSKPKVYFSRIITPEKLVDMYKVLGRELSGKVAVKIHSGEPGGNHYLKPDFIKPLVDLLKGTIVECNTAYEGRRDTTPKHLKVMEEHGFSKIANVDIMDSDGEIELKIPNGKRIKSNYVGSHLKNYNSIMVLSHFKGHLMAGFGGALKNISIGIASSHGKAYIHGAGDIKKIWSCEQDKFLESMADASKSITDFMKGNIAFINVMKDLSIDCDCDSDPAKPEMSDIGIMSSLDPVALDKACVDMVYASKDKGRASLIRRIEDRRGVLIIEASEKLGIGSPDYELVDLDA